MAMALFRARQSLSRSPSFPTSSPSPSSFSSSSTPTIVPTFSSSSSSSCSLPCCLPFTLSNANTTTRCVTLHSTSLYHSRMKAVTTFKALRPPTRGKAFKGGLYTLTAFNFCFGSLGWTSEKSPYETLGIEKHVNEEEIKLAYRRMAKRFHPDVYDHSEALHDGETAEERFIQIQAAYEFLTDREKRWEYDADHCDNPLKASKAWMEWVVKKKKAYEQRGEMAVSHWAEQQQREINLKARRLSRFKVDPEEERKILAREKRIAVENFENILKRHTLVLKKRDILRRKAENKVKNKLVEKLLQVEGLELDES